MPFRGPGTAPLTRSKFRSGSVECTVEASCLAVLQLAESGVRELALRDRPEGELNRLVTVGLGRPHLDDRAGAGIDHGHGRHLPALLVEDLAHAQLSADDAFHNLISMSI